MVTLLILSGAEDFPTTMISCAAYRATITVTPCLFLPLLVEWETILHFVEDLTGHMPQQMQAKETTATMMKCPTGVLISPLLILPGTVDLHLHLDHHLDCTVPDLVAVAIITFVVSAAIRFKHVPWSEWTHRSLEFLRAEQVANGRM